MIDHISAVHILSNLLQNSEDHRTGNVSFMEKYGQYQTNFSRIRSGALFVYKANSSPDGCHELDLSRWKSHNHFEISEHDYARHNYRTIISNIHDNSINVRYIETKRFQTSLVFEYKIMNKFYLPIYSSLSEMSGGDIDDEDYQTYIIRLSSALKTIIETHPEASLTYNEDFMAKTF